MALEIANHIQDNIDECVSTQDILQGLVETVQKQPSSDAIQKTASSAVAAINELIGDGETIQEELLGLQEIIKTILGLVHRRQTEQKLSMEQYVSPVSVAIPEQKAPV